MTVKKHKSKKDLTCLWDCDLLQYRAGFAADAQIKNEYLDSHPMATKDEIQEVLENTEYTAIALHNVKTALESVIEQFGPTYKLYIQDGPNFRYDVATLRPYKGNRDKSHKPKYYKEIKDYLMNQWSAIGVSEMESDDAIAIEQFRNPEKNTVIVSTDKDMNTVYGWHYNWVKGDLYYVSPMEADKFFFKQMLIGDATDNIQGIRGLGEIRAHKFIEEHSSDGNLGTLQRAVQEQYKKQYGADWESAYEEIGKLLYILRRPEELGKVPPLLYG